MITRSLLPAARRDPRLQPWTTLPTGGALSSAVCVICGWRGSRFEGFAHCESARCPSCGSIARDLTHLRQRALTANIGTIADVAGSLAVMAARGGGLNMKIRGLTDGMNNLLIQLDHALKQAMAGEDSAKRPSDPGPTPAA